MTFSKRVSLVALPIFLPPFLLILCNTVFYLPSFEIHPWTLTNFLTYLCVPNKSYVSENSKLTLTNERKYSMFFF